MDDLISRQAAIYNLANIAKNCAKSDKQKVLMGRCIYMIENMSSAQPEPSTEIQKILNYLDTTLHPIVSPDNWYVYSKLHDMVSMLPSAQPEPISEAYTKAVWTWLINYQIKVAELKGRYTPYEVLSWVANDWRKEHERSDK